jgi:hypothetical protein
MARAASQLTEGPGVVLSRRNATLLPVRRTPRAHRSAFVLVLASLLLVASAPARAQSQGAASPEEKVVEWTLPGLPEPSGVVYHSTRKTLFVISDEGGIGEVTLEGKVKTSRALGGDLEGITFDPATGYLYVIREGHEILFEVDPDRFAIRRRFTIDRAFEGDPDFLERGGDGIEGVTFVPDSTHPEGGRFFAVNQYDPPALIELAVPLRTSRERFERARVLKAYRIASPPLSDVSWHAGLGIFLVPSALWRSVHVVDPAGNRLRTVRVPGIMQEGIAAVPAGAYVIAQDTGGLLRWSPDSEPFAATIPDGPISEHAPKTEPDDSH